MIPNFSALSCPSDRSLSRWWDITLLIEKPTYYADSVRKFFNQKLRNLYGIFAPICTATKSLHRGVSTIP